MHIHTRTYTYVYICICKAYKCLEEPVIPTNNMTKKALTSKMCTLVTVSTQSRIGKACGFGFRGFVARRGCLRCLMCEQTTLISLRLLVCGRHRESLLLCSETAAMTEPFFRASNGLFRCEKPALQTVTLLSPQINPPASVFIR